MNPDIWIRRASLVEPYDGAGLSAYAVAKATGLTIPTVKRYADKFGFDISEGAIAPIEEIQKLASEGLNRQQVAEKLSLSVNYVSKLAKENGFEIVHASAGVGVDIDRAEAMAAMYRGGKTLEEIGTVYKVTRERVRQIISKRSGVTAAQGGQSVKASRKGEVRAAKRDADSFERHGCSYAQYRGLVSIGKRLVAEGCSRERTPTGAWASQKQNAKARGVPWNLKLWDWWQVWQDSGKWEERGRGKGRYVMCRFGDSGPYEVGSVYIAKFEHNASFQPGNPYRKGHPDHGEAMVQLRTKLRKRPAASTKKKHHDLPIGVTMNGNRFMAQIAMGGRNKYLGLFKTASEASAVYQAKRAELDALYEAAA